MKEFCQTHNITEVEKAGAEMLANLKESGLIVHTEEESNTITIQGNTFDVQGRIEKMTGELLSRTQELTRAYTHQVNVLKTKAAQKPAVVEEPKKEEKKVVKPRVEAGGDDWAQA